MSIVASDRRTALYRLYGPSGVLLYVGITYEPQVRFAEHRQTKSWWPEVAHRSVTWYDTRAEADIAEAVAIRAEMPTENKALPDEDNVFRRGVGRTRWAPSDDQKKLLAALKRAHKKAEDAEAEYKKVLAECADAEIPIAHLATEVGSQRKTIYRHLGRSMT